ncbi:MAG: L-threonylcarbamoyladenylate synthase [Cyanobacteriota bacterium]|jgi:L-threonylcarbamoyladenylate synthase
MSSSRSATELLPLIRRDEAVLLPTDTVPALAIQPIAAARVWELKRRPADKPLILMAADLSQLRTALSVPWLDPWLLEAERVWPGAVTLVLPIAGALQRRLNPGGTSLGMRVPACPMTQALLRLSGPLATTSVNLSGEPPALTAEQAHRMFPALPLLGPLPWPPGSGIPSEVREWDQDRWTVLRPMSPTPVP